MANHIHRPPYYAGTEFADLSKHDGGLLHAVGAGGDGLGDEIVAVVVLAAEGDKEAARPGPPRVDDGIQDLGASRRSRWLGSRPAGEGRHQLFDGQCARSCHLAHWSRATRRSSGGTCI